jgi:hypothetical protein
MSIVKIRIISNIFNFLLIIVGGLSFIVLARGVIIKPWILLTMM